MISAGRNVRNETLTTTESYNNGQTRGSYTSLSNQGSIAAGKNLTITAGADITNLGATLASGRSGDAAAGKLSMSAGRDINLGTVKTGSTYDANFSGYLGRAQSVTSVGSTVNAGGDLTMVAQRDLSLTAAQVAIGTNGSGNGSLMAGRAVTIGAALDKAESEISHTASKSYTQANDESVTVRGSNITAGKALEVAASGDINVVSEESYQSHSEYAKSTSRGLASSTTRTSYGKRAYTTAIGSTLSGDTTVLQAGKDMSIVGSNVVSSAGTSLVAGNNITVASASDKFESAEGSNKKSSGLLSGGGFGFTIGTRELDNKNTSVRTTAVSSNVGSIDGNVSIKAGNAYTQSGSNVLAPKGDIDVVAKQISILAAAETERSTQDMVFKQSGLTIQITSPVLSAIQTAQQMAQAAKSTSGGRMQLLAAANIGFAGKNAVDAVRTGQGFAVDGKDNPQVRTNALDENGDLKLGADKKPETRDATAADKAGGINLAISVGASKSENHSQSSASSARGSTLNAGGNISLTAQGGGADSNLIVQGSDIRSGANTLLKADNEVRLLAAQSTTEQSSSNKAMSGSVGISIGTDGFLVNAGLSGSRGRGDGSDAAQVNTHVDAGNKLTIASGTDTTIKGAVASGKQVVIDVGTSGSGNLNIESLQDTSTYKSRQQSAGVSISAGMGRMSGSLNLARSSVDGNYASVNEQSGVKAGDEGFQINVAGNTDLKGAKIASTDKAAADGKNSLTTQTLTQSDIKNRSDFKAESQSMGMGTSLAGSALGLAGSALGMGNASGSDSSTTRSGISQADIKITDDAAQQAKTGKTAEQTIASINADVSSERDTSGKIAKTWNGQELQADVEAQAEITRAFGQQVAQLAGAYAESKEKELRQAASNAAQNGDQTQALLLGAEADQWKDGGENKQALKTITTLVIGGLGGQSAGQLLANASAPYLADAIGKYFSQPGNENKGAQVLSHAILGGILASANGAHAGAGALAGATGELAAEAITRELYPDAYDADGKFHPEKLNDNQRKTVIALSTVAGTVLAGIAGGTPLDAAIGGNISENAVTNNFLGDKTNAKRNEALANLRKAYNQSFLEKLVDPVTGKLESAQVVTALNYLDNRSNELLRAFRNNPSSLSTADKIELQLYIGLYAQQNGGAAAQYLLKAGPGSSAQPADVPELSLFAQQLQGIENVHKAQAAVGSPALEAMSGPVGNLVRLVAMAQAGYQFGNGVGQSGNGDPGGLENVGLGLLSAAGTALAQAGVTNLFGATKGRPVSEDVIAAGKTPGATSSTGADAADGLKTPSGSTSSSANSARNQYYGNGGSASPSPGTETAGSSGRDMSLSGGSGANGEAVAVDAGSVKGVNPTGSTQNCTNCVAVVDNLLTTGNPASALPRATPVRFDQLGQMYGTKFSGWTTQQNIESTLLAGGDGTRAVIYGTDGATGHVWNAVVQNGKVNYIDGQIGGGGASNFKAFTNFQFGVLP